MIKLTAKDVLAYQRRAKQQANIGAWKALGRELRDKYGLTDLEAIDILNNRNVMDIVAAHE